MTEKMKRIFISVVIIIVALFVHVGADSTNEEDETTSSYLRQPRVTKSIFRSQSGQCSKESPCDECEGDCDRDSDCRGDLKCFHRDEDDDPLTPGCKEQDVRTRSDYCYDPYFETPKPHLKFRDKDFCTNFICSLCEGPCDNDDQCKGSYKCLRRNPGQSVPGCRGGNNDDSESGYCYDPDYKSIFEAPPPDDSIFPELDYKGREYCDKHLCNLCQGDCDSDADCRGNLVCHKRGENDNVPGCKGGAADNSGVDYCVLPSRGNDELKVDKYPNLRPNGREHCSEDSHCGLCEGDCDSDKDCKDRLICYQREPNEEVPGCSGGSSDSSTTDYCIEKFER